MKLQNTFLQGRMDSDTDERLLQKGVYRDALNIQVANSEGSNVGAVENIIGNTKVSNFNLTNAKCIGELEDGKSRKIYYFITSDEKDLVIEFDEETLTTTRVLESTIAGNNILKFNPDYLITGVNKIINGDSSKDLLAWTDDVNAPRILNIARAKSYPIDDFVEDDISVIKKPPRYAPTTVLQQTVNLENYLDDKFISYAYRYKYLDGEYSALSSFSNYQFFPKAFKLDYQTAENTGMENVFNQVLIEFNTGSERVTDIQLVFRESNSTSVYIIETLNKEDEILADDDDVTHLFNNSKKYEILPVDELSRLYDNVPRLSKTQEFIGNRLAYGNYLEGYNMIDSSTNKVAMNYDLNLVSADTAYKSLNYVLFPENADFDKWRMDFFGQSLNEGDVLSFNIVLTRTNASFIYNYSYILIQDFTDIAELSADSDFIYFVEEVMSSIFEQNVQDVVPDDTISTAYTGFKILNEIAWELTILAPYITYTIDDGISPAYTEDHFWDFVDEAIDISTSEGRGNKSLKSNRSYEVGMVYLDGYNRSSTVITDITNTITVPHSLSTSQNKIQIDINHNPPEWADRYKFVIKQNKGEYETMYINIFHEDGLFRWVKLEGSNRNKVKEGDVLIVKSDLSGVVDNLVKVKVLEVTQKEEDFINGNIDQNGNDVIEPPGLYMKIKPLDFLMDESDANAQELHDNGTPLAASGHGIINIGNTDNLDINSLGGYLDPVTERFINYDMNIGTRVHMVFKVKNRLTSNQSLVTYDRQFIVQENYSNFEDWYNAEVVTLGVVFEAEVKQTTNRFNWGGINDLTMRLKTENVYAAIDGTISIVYNTGDLIFETQADDIEDEVFYETGLTFDIVDNLHQGNIQNQTIDPLPATCLLDAFNCYVMGNGAESYKYQDSLNVASLQMNLRPNAVDLNGFKEIRRYADITYSEPYNENNSINGLNEFNLSRANYKEDIEKKYGSIQKMYSRDTDIVIFQEDKISKVLFGKDLLYNADSTTNLSIVDDVLGQAVSYAGEYGISRNPESFAFNGNNLYFTDVKRGAVLRLGANGLVEISANGMRTWFKDRFKENLNGVKMGAFDPYYDQYVLHLNNEDVDFDSYTLTFDEKVKGWTSFYSFSPEQMTGVNNKFFTVKEGEIYQHHVGDRNVFYEQQYPSGIKFVLNDSPSDIKAFKTLNIEGTHAWDCSILTNFTNGHIHGKEFINKENEWYTHLRRSENSQDYSALATQGVGRLESIDSLTLTFSNNVSKSLSNGDKLYVLNETNGVLSFLGNVDLHSDTTITLDLLTNTPSVNEFIVFTKDSRMEGSMIRGYYMEIDMTIDSPEMVELYGVNSEVFKSFG